MSTPSLLPQPQLVQAAATPTPQPSTPDWAKVKNALALPEFNHHIDNATQRQLLKDRAGLDLSNMNDGEYNTWKQRASQRLGVTIPPAPDNSRPRLDSAIEFARPFVADAAKALGPESAGLSIPIQMAVDGGLQHLESKAPTSMLQSKLGLDPNGLGGTLANSAEMLGTNFGLGKLTEGAGKILRDVDVPQGLKTLGKDFLTQSTANWRKYVGVGIPLHYLASAISPELGKDTSAAIAGIRLTSAAAKTIAKNPEAKQALDSIINGAPLKGGQEAAARILADTLNGSALTLSGGNSEGKTSILKDGKLTPLQ